MSLGPKIRKVLAGDAPQLVNYSYFDVASGRGYQIFYPATTISNGKKITQSTSGAFLLTTTPIYSDIVDPRCSAADLGLTAVKVQDVDFDNEFKMPAKIQGTAFLVVPHGMNVVSAGVSTTSYIQARIRKWDGVTEKELAVASGASLNVVGVAVGTQTICIKMTIPLTTFKISESLRLTIEHWALNNVSLDADIGFGVDPQDRDAQTATRPISGIGTSLTKSELHVPFVIDI
jgi:hypothetical protein